jgi:hypothetical protein
MDPQLKSQLLDWLLRYRAATGEERRYLGQQVEAFTALVNGLEEEAWLSALLAHAKDGTPIPMVVRRADLAVAEVRSILLPAVID